MVITKKWARTMLSAVNKLIKSYRKNGCRPAEGCPLCPASSADCERCPWVVFTGYHCLGYRVAPTQKPKKDPYNFTSISKRLHRLYGWRRRFKNILAKPRKKIGKRSPA